MYLKYYVHDNDYISNVLPTMLQTDNLNIWFEKFAEKLYKNIGAKVSFLVPKYGLFSVFALPESADWMWTISSRSALSSLSVSFFKNEVGANEGAKADKWTD